MCSASRVSCLDRAPRAAVRGVNRKDGSSTGSPSTPGRQSRVSQSRSMGVFAGLRQGRAEIGGHVGCPVPLVELEPDPAKSHWTRPVRIAPAMTPMKPLRAGVTTPPSPLGAHRSSNARTSATVAPRLAVEPPARLGADDGLRAGGTTARNRRANELRFCGSQAGCGRAAAAGIAGRRSQHC